jgi:hypothetical protein
MKWLTFKQRLEPGLLINLMDILLLCLVSSISFIIYIIIPEPRIFFLPLYIGMTFFLFCTVFRVTWYDEVFWYLPFMIIMPYAVIKIDNFWIFILCIFEPVRATIIVHRMIKGPYVGIFYELIGNYDTYEPLSSSQKMDRLLKSMGVTRRNT